MMKQIILASVLCLNASNVYAQIKNKPTHHIVWIHGIGGNASQAGYMKESLEKFLPKQDNSMNYVVSYFDYATKDDTLTINDFKVAFDEYLQNKFLKEGSLQSNDKISIIAHSQGGIITMHWISTVCFDEKNPSFPVCNKIVSLTTLGTPFWGSRIANFALTIKNWIGNVGIMKDYGIKQLMALSVASPAIFNLKDLFNDNREKFRALFSKKIRLMVVAGRSSVFEGLSPFFAGEKIEDDLGVPVTSSNPSFYKYSGNILGPEEKTVMEGVLPFKYSYAIVDAVHIPQLPNLIKENLGENASKWIPNIPYPSLIDIPADCIARSPEVCDSPTLKLAASNILGQRRDIKNKPLAAFAIQLKLKASDASEVNQYLRFKVTELNNFVKIGKWSEPYSNVRQVIGNTVYGYVTGSQVKTDQKSQYWRNVNLEIYFGTEVIHKTTVKVAPGLTTFVELNIDEDVLNLKMDEVNKAISGGTLNGQIGINEVGL